MLFARAPLLLATFALLLAGCGKADHAAAPPAPLEISESEPAQFCGMNLSEHAGPKGQIFLRDQAKPLWFASVRDAFAFVLLPEMPKNIAAIYVNDMARARNWGQPEPGTWIDAKKAVYVIGSQRRSGMNTEEAVPFGSTAAAEQFIQEFGGRTVGFNDMPSGYVLEEEAGKGS
jgi:nitrous oxide reductase accessory protein NosL